MWMTLLKLIVISYLLILKWSTISVTRLAIYLTLGKFLKPLATINLAKSLTFLGNFCKGVKIINFTSEIILGQLLKTFDDFLLVTLSTIGNL